MYSPTDSQLRTQLAELNARVAALEVHVSAVLNRPAGSLNGLNNTGHTFGCGRTTSPTIQRSADDKQRARSQKNQNGKIPTGAGAFSAPQHEVKYSVETHVGAWPRMFSCLLYEEPSPGTPCSPPTRLQQKLPENSILKILG